MAVSGKPKTKKTGKTPKAPAPKPPTRAELKAEALDYRKQGHGIPTIADAMNLAPAEVEKLIDEALDETRVDTIRRSVLLEINRLQDAQTAIAAGVQAGEAEAIRTMLSLEERMARLKMQLMPDMKELFSNLALLDLTKIGPSGRRMKGRPSHQPTAASVAQVEALAFAKLSIAVIAKIMHLSEDTITKYYGAIIEIARERIVAQMGGVIYQDALKGNAASARHILAAVGGPEWRAPEKPTSNRRDNDDPSLPGNTEVVHRVEVVGGLPTGSSADNPGGDAVQEEPTE